MLTNATDMDPISTALQLVARGARFGRAPSLPTSSKRPLNSTLKPAGPSGVTGVSSYDRHLADRVGEVGDDDSETITRRPARFAIAAVTPVEPFVPRTATTIWSLSIPVTSVSCTDVPIRRDHNRANQ